MHSTRSVDSLQAVVVAVFDGEFFVCFDTGLDTWTTVILRIQDADLLTGCGRAHDAQS